MSIQHQWNHRFTTSLGPKRLTLFTWILDYFLKEPVTDRLLCFQQGKDSTIVEAFDFLAKQSGQGRSYVLDSDLGYLNSIRQRCSYQSIFLQGQLISTLIDLVQDPYLPTFDLFYLSPYEISSMQLYMSFLLCIGLSHSGTLFIINQWSSMQDLMESVLTDLKIEKAFVQHDLMILRRL
jgi:hypothetical protein